MIFLATYIRLEICNIVARYNKNTEIYATLCYRATLERGTIF